MNAENKPQKLEHSTLGRAFARLRFRDQLTVFFAPLVLLLVGTFAVVGYFSERDQYYAGLVQRGQVTSDIVARQSVLALLSGIGENARQMANTILAFPDVAGVALFTAAGEPLLHESRSGESSVLDVPLPPVLPATVETKAALHFFKAVYDQENTPSPFETQDPARQLLGTIHVAMGKAQLAEFQRAALIDSSVQFVIFSVLLIGCAQWVTTRLTRPLGELAGLMHRAEQGTMNVRAQGLGSCEVAEMSHAFNTMLEVLEERAARLDTQNAKLMQESIVRQRAIDSVQASEARLRAVIDNAVDGIITIKATGKVESVNPAAERIFGYTAQEMIGNDMAMLVPALPRVEEGQVLRWYSTQGESVAAGKEAREVMAVRKGGDRFPMDLMIGDMRIKEKVLFVAIVRDITERKRAETDLIAYRDHLQDMVDAQTKDLIEARDQALVAERAMSTFLANMSHELRTPLHGILSFASFGIKKIDKAEPAKLLSYFTEIRDSGNLLLSLVNNLLDLSKLRAGKMSYSFDQTDVDRVIRDLLKEMSAYIEERGVYPVYRCVAGDSWIIADRAKIAQVVRNLLTNAIKYGGGTGGPVEVLLRRQTADTVEIEVSDRGVGIPEGELERIFDPFVQSSKTVSGAGGTGLGLAICREIIEKGHHGRITAHNRSDGGAVFTVRLPNAPTVESTKQPSGLVKSDETTSPASVLQGLVPT